MLKIVNKIWGKEEWLVNSEFYCAKWLHLKKGYQCSLHKHKIKDETFYLVFGVVELEIGKLRRRHTLFPGQQYRIKPNVLHRFKSLTPQSTILEVSTHHEDSDSYRVIKSGKIKGDCL